MNLDLDDVTHREPQLHEDYISEFIRFHELSAIQGDNVLYFSSSLDISRSLAQRSWRRAITKSAGPIDLPLKQQVAADGQLMGPFINSQISKM